MKKIQTQVDGLNTSQKPLALYNKINIWLKKKYNKISFTQCYDANFITFRDRLNNICQIIINIIAINNNFIF